MKVEVVSWDVDGTLYELPRMISKIRRLALERGLFHPLRVARELRRLSRLRSAMEAVRLAGGDLATLEFEDRDSVAPLEREWYGEAIRLAGPREGVARTLAFLRVKLLQVDTVGDDCGPRSR